MGKKSKTSSTSSSNTVTTPTNPEWVTSGVQGVQNRINSLLDADASSLVPGVSALQQQAFDAAGALSDPAAALNAAQKTAMDVANNPAMAGARSLLDVDLDAYQNPFTQSVVDTTLSGFDRSADRVRAQQTLDTARNQRFGGSRAAITASMTEAELAQQRAAQEAQLRAAGFDRATGLATGDLDREAQISLANAAASNQARISAAGLLGDIGQTNLGLLSELGGQQREIERQDLGADIELTRLIAALNASQPYNLFQGQTVSGTESKTSTTKDSDPMGTLGQALQAGAIIFSDERLKEDVRTVGEDAAGRRLVSYRYKGDDQRRLGHIAQEVRKTDPQAVKKVGKHLAIDYGLLGDVA